MSRHITAWLKTRTENTDNTLSSSHGSGAAHCAYHGQGPQGGSVIKPRRTANSPDDTLVGNLVHRAQTPRDAEGTSRLRPRITRLGSRGSAKTAWTVTTDLTPGGKRGQRLIRGVPWRAPPCARVNKKNSAIARADQKIRLGVI